MTPSHGCVLSVRNESTCFGRTLSAYVSLAAFAGFTSRATASSPTFTLLALAVSNRGRLATFDATISLKAVEGAREQNLEIISA